MLCGIILNVAMLIVVALIIQHGLDWEIVTQNPVIFDSVSVVANVINTFYGCKLRLFILSLSLSNLV
jgi:hypothetical protein